MILVAVPLPFVASCSGSPVALVGLCVKISATSDWRVPQPVPPTQHGFKCRAAYVLDGVPLVGFDNERGKGDHCHLGDQEHDYAFVSVEQLVEDFTAAVDAASGAPMNHRMLTITLESDWKTALRQAGRRAAA